MRRVEMMMEHSLKAGLKITCITLHGTPRKGGIGGIK